MLVINNGRIPLKRWIYNGQLIIPENKKRSRTLHLIRCIVVQTIKAGWGNLRIRLAPSLGKIGSGIYSALARSAAFRTVLCGAGTKRWSRWRNERFLVIIFFSVRSIRFMNVPALWRRMGININADDTLDTWSGGWISCALRVPAFKCNRLKMRGFITCFIRLSCYI